VLKFHIISEIANRTCRTMADISAWYQRTLAKYQRYDMTLEDLRLIMQQLIDDMAIKPNPERPNEFVATELGHCANFFYLDPANLADYVRNFNQVFKDHALEDHRILWALSHLRSYGEMIVSRAEMHLLDGSLSGMPVARDLNMGQQKVFLCYLNMMHGQSSGILAPTHRALSSDWERTIMALQYLDGKFAKWNRPAIWKAYGIRLKYGVPEQLVPLCMMRGVGASYATKLYGAGITTPELFYRKPKLAKEALGEKVFARIYEANHDIHEEVMNRD
jgi:replicative superfamily II helicase